MATPSRVLVTGGTGVIGSWVVRAAVEHGVTPIIFVRGQTDSIGRTINGHLEDRLVWAYGDMREPESLERAIREHGAEAIIHMASAKPWQIEKPFVDDPNPRLGIEQITLGTQNVLEAARKTGVKRVVYASSKAVYDDVQGEYAAPTYKPLPPDYPRNPHMVYGVTKMAAEGLGFYYNRWEGLEFLTIRFSSSFGPLKRGPSGPTSPDGMLQQAINGGPVRIRRYRPGEQDDFIYNKDLGEGFLLAALAEKPRHEAYNLGSGRGLTMEQVGEAIGRTLPHVSIEYADPAEGTPTTAITDRARCVMDITWAAEDFGFAPRHRTLNEAFADFLAEEARAGRVPVVLA